MREGEILGLIGPNGAGKTTCFNVMTGVYQPTSGEVRFAGEPLGSRKRFAITRLGIARTFQNIRLFGNMTALENVLVGADAHHRTNVIDALVRSPRHRREEREGEATAREVLEFVGLGPAGRRAGPQPLLRRPAPAGDRPRHGHRAAAAAAWTSRPPASTRRRRRQLMDLIRRIRDQRAHRAAHRARHEPGHGRQRPDRRAGVRPQDRRGLPAEVRNDPAVIAAYLGTEVDESTTRRCSDAARGRGPVRQLRADRGASRASPSPSSEGEIVTLIGANGAGKTTTLKTISGLRPVPAGAVLFEGEDITHMAGARAGRRWASASRPEGRGIFPGMTRASRTWRWAPTPARTGPRRGRRTWSGCFALFPRLHERRDQVGGTMSGGEQQMLAIGRALMARPKLLLLDEPSMGLAPMLIQQIFSIITRDPRAGHDDPAGRAERRAGAARSPTRPTSWRPARWSGPGTGRELAADDSVRAAYLGGDV